VQSSKWHAFYHEANAADDIWRTSVGRDVDLELRRCRYITPDKYCAGLVDAQGLHF
jgi:hypothetical protein